MPNIKKLIYLNHNLLMISNVKNIDTFSKFRGTVNNLSFYKLNGQEIVRKATRPNQTKY